MPIIINENIKKFFFWYCRVANLRDREHKWTFYIGYFSRKEMVTKQSPLKREAFLQAAVPYVSESRWSWCLTGKIKKWASSIGLEQQYKKNKEKDKKEKKKEAPLSIYHKIQRKHLSLDSWTCALFWFLFLPFFYPVICPCYSIQFQPGIESPHFKNLNPNLHMRDMTIIQIDIHDKSVFEIKFRSEMH